MKKTVKKISCAALCAVMLFCMAVPAFALVDSDLQDVYRYNIGVRARCYSTINTQGAKGKLDLSYLQGPYNYLPEEDYSVKVWLYVSSTIIGNVALEPNPTSGMHTYTEIITGGITSASFKYYLMSENIYTYPQS